jgi:hypothetical protein
MSAPNFTPGPWCYENIGEKENLYAVGVAWRLDDDEFRQIGGQVSSYDEHGNEQLHREAICFLENHSADGSTHDDARLIAAAPELYEALAQLLDASLTETLLKESAGKRAAARDAARAALAKARGVPGQESPLLPGGRAG